MKCIFRTFLVAIVCIVVVFGCRSKRKSIDTSGNITLKVEKHITVYGSINCDHCLEFRNKLDSVGIKYEFKDAEANEQYYTELLFKIQQASFKGYVSFPVLEVNDKIYVKPDFSEFMKILSK